MGLDAFKERNVPAPGHVEVLLESSLEVVEEGRVDCTCLHETDEGISKRVPIQPAENNKTMKKEERKRQASN